MSNRPPNSPVKNDIPDLKGSKVPGFSANCGIIERLTRRGRLEDRLLTMKRGSRYGAETEDMTRRSIALREMTIQATIDFRASDRAPHFGLSIGR
jgi:hypothetical protein